MNEPEDLNLYDEPGTQRRLKPQPKAVGLKALLGAITTELLLYGTMPEAMTLATCCELTAMYSREGLRR